jgi:hypothetical protein
MNRARQTIENKLASIRAIVERAQKENIEYKAEFEVSMKDNLAAIKEYEDALRKIDLSDPKIWRSSARDIAEDMRSISGRCFGFLFKDDDSETIEAARELVKIINKCFPPQKSVDECNAVPVTPCDGKTATEMAEEKYSASVSRLNSQIDRELQDVANTAKPLRPQENFRPATALEMLQSDLNAAKKRFENLMDNARSYSVNAQADMDLNHKCVTQANAERENMSRITAAIDALTSTGIK